MNILQVGTTDIKGGAAKVSYRLHQEFKKLGHISKMAVGYKLSKDPDVFQFGPGGYSAYLQRQIEYYTGAQLYSSFQKKKYFQEADVVNCHNLHGGFFKIKELAEISQKKPLVWTLHDEWAYTGHCSYTMQDNCRKWLHGCEECPDLAVYPHLKKDTTSQIWQAKKTIYSKSKLFIVTPSNWLKKRVEQSILSGFETVCIPNGIDCQVFQPTDTREARAGLGLPQDKKIIVFNAADIGSEFKGFSLLLEALRHIQSQEDVVLLALGAGGKLPGVKFKVLSPGYIESETDLAKYYSAADLFVLPSVSETFPLVVLESMACATPVVAFDVGGVAEAVRHMETGYVASYKDSADLACGMTLFLADDVLRQKAGVYARKVVQSNYGLDLQAKRYLEVYQRIVSA